MKLAVVICALIGLLSACASQAMPPPPAVVTCPRFEAPKEAMMWPARTDYVGPARQLKQSLQQLEESVTTLDRLLTLP